MKKAIKHIKKAVNILDEKALKIDNKTSKNYYDGSIVSSLYNVSETLENSIKKVNHVKTLKKMVNSKKK